MLMPALRLPARRSSEREPTLGGGDHPATDAHLALLGVDLDATGPPDLVALSHDDVDGGPPQAAGQDADRTRGRTGAGILSDAQLGEEVAHVQRAVVDPPDGRHTAPTQAPGQGGHCGGVGAQALEGRAGGDEQVGRAAGPRPEHTLHARQPEGVGHALAAHLLQLGIGLGHHGAVPVGFDGDGRPLGVLGPSSRPQHPRRAQRRVAGEGELHRRGEDAHLVLARRDHHRERGLAEVDLAGDGGHAGLGIPGIADDDSRGGTTQAARAWRGYRNVRLMQASITSVADCPKPVISAVHGYCIGGGIDLITACDIRLAAADAVFSVRETRIAIVADVGTLQRLPRIIPSGHVAELAFTGKDIGAERARQIGLVNDVLPDADAVIKAARELAAEIAANSPLTVQGVKAVLRASADRTVEEGLDYVAAWNMAYLQSDDLKEAVAAFLEKRPAVFRGE